MNKAYSRINNGNGWQNFPSMDTPLDKYNLDKVDVGLNEVDNRVIVLDETKASKIEVSTLFKEVSYEKNTGIITFTRKNGATVTIDTPMEKIQTGIYYNPDTEKLVLPLIDGTTMEVDLSRLMKFDEFIDSDTIAFSVKSNGTVTAIVKEGSIEEKHLQPNYLADIKVEVAKAQASATAAATSEANSKVSENAAKSSEDAAKESEENAASYATNASESATTATQKAAEAAESEANAAISKESAAESAEIATAKADIATEKANIATQGADTATEKATEASNYATEAESYAHGGTGTRENEDSDNAKYYYEQLQNASQGLNGLIPMGNITFEELANEENQQPGYFFNVSDSFVSDERFKDGSGIFYGAGNNVLYTADGMWDVTAASMVSGVKGDKETEYRQGFVNISCENIGALPADGDSQNNTVTFESDDELNPTAPADVALITSGETHKGLFKKISTVAKNVRYLLKMLGSADISAIADGTVTGAINLLNTDLTYAYNNTKACGGNVSRYSSGQYRFVINNPFIKTTTEIEITGMEVPGEKAVVWSNAYISYRNGCAVIYFNFENITDYGSNTLIVVYYKFVS